MRRWAALGSVLCACSNETAKPTAGPVDPPPQATSAAVVASSASSAASPSASSSVDGVSHASTPYERSPSVLASGGTVDGAALMKRHRERLSADVSPVTVLQGTGPLELGKRICEAVTPRRPPATPVLLKPNLCGFDSIKDPAKFQGDDGVHGRGTDVEFTRGVVQCLKARGHTTITIAEGCGISNKHWNEVARITGYDVMAREEGVALVALDDDGVFDVEGDQPGKPLAVAGIGKTHIPTFLLAKTLAEHLDHGLFLSLPKLKAHRYAVVSIGIKGGQGVVMLSDRAPAYKQKYRMHKELNLYLDLRKGKDEDGNAVTPEENRALYVQSLLAFSERMADVLELVTPDAVLVDGAPAMSGDGFQRLVPSAEMVAIGGTNPVLVDRVGAQFLGLWNNASLARELGGHGTSPLLEVAAKRLGIDLASPSIVGDGAPLLASRRPVHFKAMAPFTLDWDPPAVDREPHRGAPPTPPPVASAPAAPAAPAARGPGELEIHAAALGSDTIKIDGVGDDAAWARATPVTYATDYAGKPTSIATRVRMLWSKDALQVLFELEGAGLHTDASFSTAVDRPGLYKEDCVELFLSPDAARPRRYFEVELGPFGHFFDLDVDRDRHKQDVAWSSGAKIATKRDVAARTATIEVALTAPEITAAMTKGARLPIALYRIEGLPDRTYLAWRPPRTAKPSFHVDEGFGTLVLDD